MLGAIAPLSAIAPNNHIYRITAHNGACGGCAAPLAERFMLIAESGRVHLHGVVTRDVRLSF